MENIRHNTRQNLEIAAIIIAIITFVIAVIPCLGLIAIIPGIVAVVLGITGLSQASGNQPQRNLFTASLIIATVACLISVSQIFVAGKLLRKTELGKFPVELVKEIKAEISKELRNEDFSIKIENNEEVINVNVERQRILEELENSTSRHDSLQKN